MIRSNGFLAWITNRRASLPSIAAVTLCLERLIRDERRDLTPDSSSTTRIFTLRKGALVVPFIHKYHNFHSFDPGMRGIFRCLGLILGVWLDRPRSNGRLT